MSHVQNKHFFAPFAVRVHTGRSDFPFHTPTKLFIRLHIKYKNCFPKIINDFINLDSFDKMKIRKSYKQ